MSSIRQVIEKYFEEKFPMDGEGNLVLGTLLSKDDSIGDLSQHYIFQNNHLLEKRLRGEVIISDDVEPVEIYISTSDDYLSLKFLRNALHIHVEPFQVYDEDNRFHVTVRKEDWISPPSFEMVFPGDYISHKKKIYEAIKNFNDGQKKELVLPKLVSYLS